MTSTTHGFSTQAIHVGQDADPTTGATVVPIYATSTYTQAAPGQHKGYEYSRTGNPTRAALETCLAALEGGERGLAFASGLAATNAVLAQLKPGDEVAAAADLYGGTFRILERVFKPWGLVARYTDDPSEDGFRKIITPKTKMVWIETPTNPLLQIIDIAAIAKLAHKAGAVLAVDNTFASPYLQQPIKLGADLVVHSTTKYLGGHSDVVGGAVIGSKDLDGADRVLSERRRWCAWPVRLVARAARHQDARRPHGPPLHLADWLAKHPGVSHVYFPGLASHPGHELAKRQMRAFGGMISISITGGKDAALKFLTRTKLFSLAESLGGVESLVCHPATMTHASIPLDIRLARGIDDGLVRLSVGIEDAADLRVDLARALEV